DRLLVPYRDVPREMYEGLQTLRDKRNPESRHAHAAERLKRYAGMTAATRPLTELARERTEERAGAGLLWPYRGAVEQHLDNCQRYVAGISELFRASAAADWQTAHERLSAQVRAYCDWVRKSVLTRARATPRLPPELYADRLKDVGVDISPEQAISLGTAAFRSEERRVGS